MQGSGPPDWWIAVVAIAIVLGVIERLRPLGPGECRRCRGRGGHHYKDSTGTTWYSCSACDGTGKTRR
ncbi:hypothetical protein [Streptomyces sp. NPDC047928]|uniref:hypothetical protein n=1 Tax=unclassified Streptomyces TaxID=2593676 RepID=UPI003713F94C